MDTPQKIMLLGSGELGKEFVIAAKRLGRTVIAVDNYAGAPAMQIADHSEVIDMLDAPSLRSTIAKYKPDLVVPEVESIRTEVLKEIEKRGTRVIPTAEATHLTMNRDAIRDLVANELKLKTAPYAYAVSVDELRAQAEGIGFPVVVKPCMSSSGKGQSVVKEAKQLSLAWKTAVQGARGDSPKIIVEKWIPFESEITLLTVRQLNGPTLFVDPIGHRQKGGDYQESWIPASIPKAHLAAAKRIAKKVTDRLGGAGVFGVEFFVTKQGVLFSELSPRPHDTGMVTLISQDLSEFDLHARAILGLPIPKIAYRGPAASAVILAKKPSKTVGYRGLEKALSQKNTDVRIFGKPNARTNRRMGVALAVGSSIANARKRALHSASQVELVYR